MRNIKLFIWDFDGTLMDTYPNLTGYLRRALLDFGYDVSNVEILEQMLDNVGHALRFFSEKYNLTELAERYDLYYQAGRNDPAELFPGVRETLEQIRAMGGINLIYTNRGDSIYPMLDAYGITDAFAEIINTTHPAFEWKPAPGPITYLMEKYGAAPYATVMIGDRVCDLESGWNAGCRTCHLLTPSVPQYPPCDWRVSSFAQLRQLLTDSGKENL